jgi:tungstate transport system ATP-binding protein
MTAHCVLTLSGLEVERGGVTVLEIPSFELHDGEIVAVMGPNGSGKTSLLLSMMGLLPRRAGRLLWRGAEVEGERAAVACRRRMALILQETLLFHDTVAANVASGLRLRHLPRAEIRARVDEALERFGLTALARRSARALSGGEARRVCLARALAVRPEVVLLDEPFANLDAPSREAITEGLEHTLRQAGTAAVLVTHDQADALRLSDRVAVMHGGRVVQSGPPAAVVNAPIDARVAALVGMETVLEGVVLRRVDGEVVASVAGREIHAVGEAAPGDVVYCCIRPEHVVLESAGRPGATSARNLFPARVAGVTSVGPYLKVKLDCGFPLVASVTSESFASLAVTRGKDLLASFKATAIHVIRKA